MHPLISYDVAKLMLDDHLRDATEARRAHEIRILRKRSHPLRTAVRRGLIALTRPASPRRTEAPADQAMLITIRLNERR